MGIAIYFHRKTQKNFNQFTFARDVALDLNLGQFEAANICASELCAQCSFTLCIKVRNLLNPHDLSIVSFRFQFVINFKIAMLLKTGLLLKTTSDMKLI